MFFFFFQAEDGIRDRNVTGVQTCALPILTHIPSGLVVASQQERSQHKNKQTALKILKNKLYQLEAEKQEKKKAEMDSAKQDVSFGSQARSYVFQPYTMVNDHRTELKI